MSLKPSNMISMQFLTITVDLIIKFRVDPYSRHRFLTCLSKIVKNRHKTILLASRSHQKWIPSVFLYRTNPKWSDLNRSKQFSHIFRHCLTFCWLSWHLVTSLDMICYVKTRYVILRYDMSCYDMIYHDMISWYDIKIWFNDMIPWYDIMIWYHNMISYYDIIIWYHNMIS